jgi:hypothetical protein
MKSLLGCLLDVVKDKKESLLLLLLLSLESAVVSSGDLARSCLA